MSDFSNWDVKDDPHEQSGILYMRLTPPGAKESALMRIDVADQIPVYRAYTLADELTDVCGVHISTATAEALVTPGSDGLSPLQRMANQAEERFRLRMEIMAENASQEVGDE